MKRSLLEYVSCPNCKEILESTGDDETGEIITGNLFCRKCLSSYMITGGVPDFVNKEEVNSKITVDSYSSQWTMRHKGYFERKTLYGRTEDEELAVFLKGFSITKETDLKGKVIVDVGCGSGRLTRLIGQTFKDATVIGVDYSDGALIAFEECSELENVHIIRADIYKCPLKSQVADFIWCVGMLHHCVPAEKAFTIIDSLVSDKGRVYVHVYPNYLFRPFFLMRKFLPYAYLLPPLVLYGLSWVLAPLLYAYDASLFFTGKYKIKPSFKASAFIVFDHLVAENVQCFSQKEVKNWFVNCAYRDIKVIGDIRVVASK